MKRLLYILPFLLLPLLAAQADTIAHEQGMPLFIVDGKVGVSKNDIPSPDEIASATFISYEEGVELYGKRATNGVLIIRTKNYEKEHVQEVQNAGKQQNRGKKNQPGKLGRFIQKITGGNQVLGSILTGIIVLSLYALPIVIPKIITKYKKRHKKSRGRKPTYYSGTFDASGEVFRVTDNPWYYVILLLLMASAVGVCIILYRLATSPKASFSVVSVLVFLFFVALLVFLVCLAYGYYEKRKCHLIIDKDGIRGTFAKPERFTFKPKLRNVTIRWDDLTGVEVLCENENFLDFYHKKGAVIPYKSIYLEFLPTKKIINCINFFSERQMGAGKQSARVKPVPFENSSAFILILIFLVSLLLYYLCV